MLISKEEFVEAIEAYKSYSAWEMELYNLGVNFFEREELQNLLYKYIDLLNIVTEQKKKGLQNTDLEYFIYDVDCGKYCDKYYIQKEDGSIIKWHNASEFYDYLKTVEKST